MKITVIVVTYNAEKWITSCFGSLLNNSIKHNVIIVDNASTDNTVSILKAKYPEFELITSEKNLGFGKANNIGIRKAYKSGSDFFFLLNQDACVETDTIQKICELQSKNPDYGIISPMQLAEHGKIVDKRFLNYISKSNNNSLVSDIITGQYSKTLYPFEFINAAIWCISRRCIEEVGGFDELFYHYGEDVDYSVRVLNKGLKIGVTPFVKGFHNRQQVPLGLMAFDKKIMYIDYLLYFKNTDKPLSKKIRSHLVHTLKFSIINLLKFKLSLLGKIISVNMKLIRNRKSIICSRKEQANKLAFIR